MAKLRLSAPWYIRVRELEVMFVGDPGVSVVFDEDACVVNIYVEDPDQAAALDVLLPKEYIFGSYTLEVKVIPANKECKVLDANTVSKDMLYETAFVGNSAFSFANTVTLGTNTLTYVVFSRVVVQFFTDDLGDAFGNCSTLYQEVAKNVFGESEGVSFCTDINDPEEEFEVSWP